MSIFLIVRIVIGVIGVLAICLLICGGVYWNSRGMVFKKLYHDKFLWHIPKEGVWWFDGCSYHSACKICDRKIMKDGQGNWF